MIVFKLNILVSKWNRIIKIEGIRIFIINWKNENLESRIIINKLKKYKFIKIIGIIINFVW